VPPAVRVAYSISSPKIGDMAELSSLAKQLLTIHRAHPIGVFYATPNLISDHSVIELDGAYDELLDKEQVIQTPQWITVQSQQRQAFKLNPTARLVPRF